MQVNKNIKITFLLALPAAVFLLAGCSTAKWPTEVVLQSGPSEKQARPREVSRRFQGPVSQAPTVLESAVELSGKYAKLADEAAVLRWENYDLTVENSGLKNKLTGSETRLHQAQKELAEANDLLIGMRIELNNWKTDILGFRGEMREAEKAQLEALLRILRVLGGEIKTESAQDKDQDSTAISLAETSGSYPKESSNSGEPG